MLYVPSEQIWLPDVVLFNNWDGNYEVTLMTKAQLKYTGEVIILKTLIMQIFKLINI